MRLAWNYLAANGGQAPGCDNRRYGDFPSVEIWEWCRCLASAVRDGTYRTGPERIRWIEKTSGKGQRPVVLLSIADRVVQRAVFSILQPVFEPLFSPLSLGFRPRRGSWHALIAAEYLTATTGRSIWLIEDLRDAFGHVPISRLLQVVASILPSQDLIDLLERIVPSRQLPGLRQGGSLSPLMLNLYLHHFLDRPWAKRNPQVPLIRVADDFLLLNRTECQARQAREELLDLLLPAGLPLKTTEKETIHDLRSGSAADWLGFAIRKGKRGLSFGISARGWMRLDRLFALAHTRCDAHVRAVRDVILPWLRHRAPAYASENRRTVCRDIARYADAHAFEEIPSLEKLQGYWRKASECWDNLRRQCRDKHRETGSVV
jgi:RNA-directed DNA polymerase